MYDYGLVQQVCDRECVCKSEGSFYYVWLNCINIACVHFILHMGIEIYACICICICINIRLPLFEEINTNLGSSRIQGLKLFS